MVRMVTKRRVCLLCGGPPMTPRAYYCEACRPIARMRRRKAASERWAKTLAARPDHNPEQYRKVPRASSTERGYGADHQRLRKEWKPKVEAGGVVCARCGYPIPPGSAWDLGHDPFDRSKWWGPEHPRCNRGWRRLGGVESADYNPWQVRKTTAQRGLGADHERQRRKLLPLAYGRPCPMCGEVMYPDQPLDLDHLIPRASGRPGPVRIVHRSCNRSAGARLGNLLRKAR